MPVLNNQVQTILHKLRIRDVGLRWIADEITSVIDRGKPSVKTVTEPGQKRAVKAATTESLTETEEMIVTLKVLQAYFCDAPQMWLKAATFAADNVTIPARAKARGDRLNLRLLDQEATAVEFGNVDQKQVSRFAKLLAEAVTEEERPREN
jgi:hypothetical protein